MLYGSWGNFIGTIIALGVPGIIVGIIILALKLDRRYMKKSMDEIEKEELKKELEEAKKENDLDRELNKILTQVSESYRDKPCAHCGAPVKIGAHKCEYCSSTIKDE